MVLHNAEVFFYIWGMFADKVLWEASESTGRPLIFGEVGKQSTLVPILHLAVLSLMYFEVNFWMAHLRIHRWNLGILL